MGETICVLHTLCIRNCVKCVQWRNMTDFVPKVLSSLSKKVIYNNVITFTLQQTD